MDKPPIPRRTYFVYILKNHVGLHYIGLTSNVQTRLTQHNEGISRFTRHKGPWTLRWSSTPMSLSEARKLENKLKSHKGGLGLKKFLDAKGS